MAGRETAEIGAGALRRLLVRSAVGLVSGRETDALRDANDFQRIGHGGRHGALRHLAEKALQNQQADERPGDCAACPLIPHHPPDHLHSHSMTQSRRIVIRPPPAPLRRSVCDRCWMMHYAALQNGAVFCWAIRVCPLFPAEDGDRVMATRIRREPMPSCPEPLFALPLSHSHCCRLLPSPIPASARPADLFMVSVIRSRVWIMCWPW